VRVNGEVRWANDEVSSVVSDDVHAWMDGDEWSRAGARVGRTDYLEAWCSGVGEVDQWMCGEVVLRDGVGRREASIFSPSRITY